MSLNEQREQLIRVMVGAILMNTHERDDILTFCSMLASDKSIGADVSRKLSSLVGAEVNVPSRKNSFPEVSNVSGMTEDIFLELQSLGVSKRVCLDAMKKANPSFATPSGIDKMSLRELLRRFGNQSSTSQLAKFMNAVLVREVDPYLRRM